MFANSSLLSVSVALLYLLVAGACLAAGLASASRTRNRTEAGKWFAIAAFFIMCFAFRAFEIEEGVRPALRADLRAEGLYDARRSTQRIWAALVVLVGTAVVFALVYYLARQRTGRRALATGAAILGAAGLLGLMALRMISLHQIDALLFGPLKLNWVVDVGASLLVMGAALYYRQLLTRRQ